jgi:hypothetical protein
LKAKVEKERDVRFADPLAPMKLRKYQVGVHSVKTAFSRRNVAAKNGGVALVASTR